MSTNRFATGSVRPRLVRPMLALALLLTAAGPAWAETAAAPTATGATQPARLATTEVVKQTVSREFRLDGVVEAVNQATVSAQTSGEITEILVDVDDVVEKGALLVRLRDSAQQAQLKKALAGEKEARAQLARAEDDYQRTLEVYRKKVVSKAKMDEAKHALSAAKARLEAARATLAAAREQLSYTRVTAPYSGIVTRRHVEAGESVQPGTPLLTGVSLDKLRVNVDVPQNLVARVRQYGKAYIYLPSLLSDASQRIAAESITVFPIADPQTNTFRVRLELPEGIANLFPGMFVKVALVTGEKDVLTAPARSIVYRSEVTAVYVVDDKGGIHFRHVRLGASSPRGRVILAGLQAGERVALDPIAAGATLVRQRRPHGGE